MQQHEDVVPALPWREHPVTLAVKDDGSHPIAVPDEQLAEDCRELAQDVFLGPSGWAERH